VARPRWFPDELARAGPEHLDPAYAARYDRKTGSHFDPVDEVALLRELGLGETHTLVDLGAGTGAVALAAATVCRRVVAVDVSPAMLERARSAVPAENVDFRAVSGDRLDVVASGEANVLVCYLVLQHLPGRRVVTSYLREFARVLAPDGAAFVQLPVLEAGLRPRLWRALRRLAVPVAARLSRDPERAPAFRGFRLSPSELERALSAAGLRVAARDEGPDAPYRHSRDVFLRLERA
jgi:ubiquinone/menaquinone biosynthesis C-methylase UbiE